MPAYDLSGRVALVTGAARGIGLGTARALHRRGASVALVDLDAADAERAAAAVGPRAIGLAADVGDAAAVRAAVEQTIERLGGLDVAVANAGISPNARTARVYEPELFERVVDVNLLGVWRTVNAALPHVVERRGQLVLVASIYAFVNGTFVSPYAVSKAGVEQLGRALRVELAPHGVGATVGYFGFVDTDMVRLSVDEDPLGQRFREMIPRPLLKRIGPEAAGEALARGIERRAPRVVAPRRWALLSATRGLFGPLMDARLAHDRRLRAVLREADVEGRMPTRVG